MNDALENLVDWEATQERRELLEIFDRVAVVVAVVEAPLTKLTKKKKQKRVEFDVEVAFLNPVRENSTESSYHLQKFKSSVCIFSPYGEDALNIQIQRTDDVSGIFPGYCEVQIDPGLDHLRLEEFDHDDVLTFNRSKHGDLNVGQRRFLLKLQRVVINAKALCDISMFESYVQDMVRIFLEECKFDDCRFLEVAPSDRRMVIDGKYLGTFCDKECRRIGHEEPVRQLTWVLQVSKKDYEYKDGEIELVTHLIAACQNNYSFFGDKIFPEVLYGINVRVEKVFILRIVFTKTYIDSLYRGLPKEKLEVKRYPEHGLSLSSPLSRREILSVMTKLRKFSLSPKHEYS